MQIKEDNKVPLARYGKKRDKQRRQFTGRGQMEALIGKKKNQVKRRVEFLKEEGWDKVWDKRTLIFVAITEMEYAENFDKGLEVTNADILETMVNWGITKMAWLGNFPTEDKKGNITKPFLAYAESAREFDDKRHRIDTVVTIKLSEEMQQRFPNIPDGEIVMGLDVTTWKKDFNAPTKEIANAGELEHFAEKISRSNNDGMTYQGNIPFGFSQVDFYINPWKLNQDGRREKGYREMVPRFVVGVDNKIAGALMRDDFVVNKKTKQIELKDEDTIRENARTAMTGFKMMSEIKAQAELLIQMMPDDWKESPECVLARDELVVIKEKMRAGLRRNVRRVVELMDEQGILPYDMAKQLNGASYAQAINMLERLFKDEKRRSEDKKAEVIYDPTYAGIMRATMSFKQCAANPKSELLRRLKPRGKAVEWLHGSVHPLRHEREELGDSKGNIEEEKPKES
ncbi:hypothetical protein IKG05_00065 [Candidatus Saccharibacteria bacterium]|nr:hypothetical protein [Candidatus Saccharibacteria bacterium]